MENVKLSIIIPTLNEEDYLPLLLASIENQDFADYEIIVADAGSKDATVEIAKKHNCVVVNGGLPARGRNNGAKAAKGDLLLFLDADTVLPDYFLSKSLEEFGAKKLDMASFGFNSTSKNKRFHLMLNFYNKMIVELQDILPHAAIGILASRDIFEKLQGYDEKLKLSEDHDLARRAVKYGAFGIITSVKIFVSDRRFVKDGWLTIAIKYLLSELHTLFIGPIKSDIFNYEFDHYDKDATKRGELE